MKKETLNTNELRVFQAACEDANQNGYDFGFADDLRVEGLSAHQIAGYVGSLVKKDAIRITDDEYRQTVINPDFAAVAGVPERDVQYLRTQGYFTEDHAVEVTLVA